MEYIITGGTSFIGIALSGLLLKEGHHVYSICRETSAMLKDIPEDPNLTPVFTDLGHIGSIARTIKTADVMIHLAWEGTDHKGREDSELQKMDIEYSKEAVRTAKQLGCRLFVEAGSQAEYGHTTAPFTEETPCHPESEYGKAKLAFGAFADKYCKENGMKFIHLRIVSVFGEKDKPWTLIISTIKKMLSNEAIELSSCSQNWNFLYIRDAVKQIYLLCRNMLQSATLKSEIYLVGSRDTRPMKEFIEEIRRISKSESVLLYGRYQPAKEMSLSPIMKKTEEATGGFLSDYSFGEAVENMIDNIRREQSWTK